MLDRYKAVRAETTDDILPHLVNHAYPAVRESTWMVGTYTNTMGMPFYGPFYLENRRAIAGQAHRVRKGTYNQVSSVSDRENNSSLHRVHVGHVSGEPTRGQELLFSESPSEFSPHRIAARGLLLYVSGELDQNNGSADIQSRWDEIAASERQSEEKLYKWLAEGGLNEAFQHLEQQYEEE